MGYSDAYPGGYGVVAGLVTSLFIETTADTWYDATDQLISGSTARGKQNELDRYQAGTMTVVLDNDDRTFDPTYAASPLNGHILPMKRVRLTATWDGVEYPLFFGYADRWTQNREGPHRGTTTLDATDGFKLLERAGLASSAYAQEVAADGPVHWWRLDEAGGTVAYDQIGDLDLTAIESPTLGEATLLSRDPGAAMLTDDPADGVATRGPIPVTAGPLSIEAVVKLTSEGVPICGFATEVQGIGFDLFASETIGFEVSKSAGVFAQCPSTVDYTDDATHHLCGTWASDGTMKIYVDGVDRTSGTPSLASGAFAATEGFTFIGRSPIAGGSVGTYDEVAIYDTALSATRVAAHAAAITTPWDAELTGARIERILDAVGWPAGLRNVDPGTTTLQSATLDMSALEHIQTVAETEFGNLYVTADGTLRFEDRESAVNQPVVATFSDAPGGDLPITFSDPEISDEHIRNNVTVSRLEGVAQNVQDAASIATYQTASYSRDGLYHDNDAHSRYLAQFILAGYKTPVERVSRMAVNPYADTALWPAILALELTDRVVLNETPQNVAPEVSRTLIVEGVTHTFGPKQWDASFNLSENTAATAAYWALGVAGYSELGETTRLYL